jgi:aspartyl-tRNA(Asn)/glutamyl-tRNA(Gln) amidotransferase subunit C
MLSEKEVKHIAALARIGLSGNEIEKYRRDLSAILDYFKKLEELNTDGIEPIGHITGRFNSCREDKVQEFGSLGREAILKNAPEKREGYVKVKSVL